MTVETWKGRVLTVRLPWAWAISSGAKPVENRTMNTNYSGPPLEAVDFGPYFRKVLAVADLADCHPAAGCCEPWGEDRYQDAAGRTRTDVYHWVLADVRQLEAPLPARGRLGLWRPDPDLADAIAADLRASAL